MDKLTTAIWKDCPNCFNPTTCDSCPICGADMADGKRTKAPWSDVRKLHEGLNRISEERMQRVLNQQGW